MSSTSLMRAPRGSFSVTGVLEGDLIGDLLSDSQLLLLAAFALLRDSTELRRWAHTSLPKLFTLLLSAVSRFVRLCAVLTKSSELPLPKFSVDESQLSPPPLSFSLRRLRLPLRLNRDLEQVVGWLSRLTGWFFSRPLR